MQNNKILSTDPKAVYMRNYFKNNPLKRIESNIRRNQYRKQHKEKENMRVKKWKQTHQNLVLKSREKYRKIHREELRKKAIAYNMVHREERRAYQRVRSKTQSEKDRKHKHYLDHKEEYIKRAKVWKKNNPVSTHRYGLELYLAMNLVRKRDNNTCKWGGCGKSYKQTKIHVHHIFPKNEYTELVYETRYMICYCTKHHRMFHKSRGDKYYRWLEEKPVEIIQKTVK